MLLERLGKELLYFDGGMGTLLQSKGLQPGELPEVWNLEHAEEIIDIHKAYFEQAVISCLVIHLVLMRSNSMIPSMD